MIHEQIEQLSDEQVYIRKFYTEVHKLKILNIRLITFIVYS